MEGLIIKLQIGFQVTALTVGKQVTWQGIVEVDLIIIEETIIITGEITITIVSKEIVTIVKRQDIWHETVGVEGIITEIIIVITTIITITVEEEIIIMVKIITKITLSL
jgi:hypothetical protein